MAKRQDLTADLGRRRHSLDALRRCIGLDQPFAYLLERREGLVVGRLPRDDPQILSRRPFDPAVPVQGAGKLKSRRCRVRLDGDRPLADLHGLVVAAAAQKQPTKADQGVQPIGVTRQDLAIARLGRGGSPGATVNPGETQVPFRRIEPTVADGRPQGVSRAPA